jgi:hypothetical protein
MSSGFIKIKTLTGKLKMLISINCICFQSTAEGISSLGHYALASLMDILMPVDSQNDYQEKKCRARLPNI